MAVLNTKLVTLFLVFSLFNNMNTRKHPLHVSTTEVNFNANEKNLEISCRIFTDDFESILSKTYKQKTDLSNPALKSKMDELIKKYIISHLQLKVNAKTVTMEYVGFEIDHEATNVYLEVENIPTLRSAQIDDTILYDLFEDQMSIVHLISGKTRKSTKILYPDKTFSANF